MSHSRSNTGINFTAEWYDSYFMVVYTVITLMYMHRSSILEFGRKYKKFSYELSLNSAGYT